MYTRFPAIGANRAVRTRREPYLRRILVLAVPRDDILERRARVDGHLAVRAERDQADLSVREDGELRGLVDHAHLPLAVGDLAFALALYPLDGDLFATHSRINGAADGLMVE